VCDNCVDDDGDGLVDLEDASCCARGVTLTLKKGSLRSRPAGRAAVKLKAALADGILGEGAASTEDVTLQIRRDGEGELLCARMSAASLARRGGRLTFRDPEHRLASALGIDGLALVEKRSGGGRLAVAGRLVALVVPGAGPLRVTLGLRDPATAEAENRCAVGAANFRRTRKGLRFP
jgi:hypothetical protein